MYDNFDKLIGYHIYNVSYVWAGKPKIKDCFRIYLLDRYQTSKKYYFKFPLYSRTLNDKEITSNFFYGDKLIPFYSSLMNRCKEESEYTNIVRNFFLGWDRYELVELLSLLKKNGYTPKLKIKINSNFKKDRINTLKKVYFIEGVKTENSKLRRNKLTMSKFDSTFFTYKDYQYFSEKSGRFSRFFLGGTYKNKENIKTFTFYSNFLNAYILGIVNGDSSKVSEHFSIDIPIKIFDRIKKSNTLEQSPSKIKNIIEKSFISSNKNFKLNFPNNKSKIYFSGVLIYKGIIYTIVLGDSRIILKKRFSADVEELNSVIISDINEKFLGGYSIVDKKPDINYYDFEGLKVDLNKDNNFAFILILTSDLYRILDSIGIDHQKLADDLSSNWDEIVMVNKNDTSTLDKNFDKNLCDDIKDDITDEDNIGILSAINIPKFNAKDFQTVK